MHRTLAALLALLASWLAAPAFAADCGITSVGLTPLIDMGSATYQGEPGGLYPGGVNQIPPWHLADGLAQAALIQPLDALGNPSPTGKIVILAIGFSNQYMEMTVLKDSINADPARASSVVFVNAASSGSTAEEDRVLSPTGVYWTWCMDSLAVAGVTAAQVQVIYAKYTIKNAAAHFGGSYTFPKMRDSLASYTGQIMRTTRSPTRFPNARACYLASRIYAGYSASDPMSPEPHAYDGAFGLRKVIARQMSGDPYLCFRGCGTAPAAPWVGWGPYFWADGTIPRSDGVTWVCSELSADGVHPSLAGQRDAAHQWMDFIRADPLATLWYRGQGATVRQLLAPDAGTSVRYLVYDAQGRFKGTIGSGVSLGQFTSRGAYFAVPEGSSAARAIVVVE